MSLESCDTDTLIYGIDIIVFLMSRNILLCFYL